MCVCQPVQISLVLCLFKEGDMVERERKSGREKQRQSGDVTVYTNSCVWQLYWPWLLNSCFHGQVVDGERTMTQNHQIAPSVLLQQGGGVSDWKWFFLRIDGLWSLPSYQHTLLQNGTSIKPAEGFYGKRWRTGIWNFSALNIRSFQQCPARRCTCTTAQRGNGGRLI